MTLTLQEIIADIIEPAYALLPARMNAPAATVQLLATTLQEDPQQLRRQMGNGPARGLWQFERGGGVKGVMTHPASAEAMQALCLARGCPFAAMDIWERLETDDVLAAGAARLLYWTDPKRLPDARDEDYPGAWAAAGWALYLRTWRPGQPHREFWDAHHMAARRAVGL